MKKGDRIKLENPHTVICPGGPGQVFEVVATYSRPGNPVPLLELKGLQGWYQADLFVPAENAEEGKTCQ